jgi:hypothetical protein
MKVMILAAFAAISLGMANAQLSATYHPPAQNSYQNNWMSGGA